MVLTFPSCRALTGRGAAVWWCGTHTITRAVLTGWAVCKVTIVPPPASHTGWGKTTFWRRTFTLAFYPVWNWSIWTGGTDVIWADTSAMMYTSAIFHIHHNITLWLPKHGYIMMGICSTLQDSSKIKRHIISWPQWQSGLSCQTSDKKIMGLNPVWIYHSGGFG